MTIHGWVLIALFGAIILLLTRPVGRYMTTVFQGGRCWLSPVLAPLERGLYRLGGIRPEAEQHWLSYATAMLLFNAAGFVLLYALQRTQAVLPLNPRGLDAVPPDLAFNTAVSFMTNTNWQSYVPEATLSHLVQMLGLTVQNFLSAATGIALSLALIRGFARRSSDTIGNFWVDMTRATLYVLLPACVLLTLVLVWQGVPQNLAGHVAATTLEGATQMIAQGPVASQEAIKMLGTNGGGFFNANSAHPYENPTALTNLLQMVLIFVITTAASCGAVNAMHDSLTPLGGMVPLLNILLGEVIIGGVGAGLYGMLLFVIVAMFIAGLMVGRTPEYLGKKLEAREVKMTMLAILVVPFSILGFTAWAVVVPAGTGAMGNAGPHGFVEVLYAFASATGNNGSAFAGLSANTPFLNTTLGIAMLVGRFLVIVPMLAIAGSLAAKRTLPASAGMLPTHGPLFIGLLVGVVLVTGGLTFLPALALGPIAEHLAMLAGTTF